MKKTFIKPFIKMGQVQGLHDVIATSGPAARVGLRANFDDIEDEGYAD